jgi:hypothetical protein
VYLGDNWPEAYRGHLFTLNLHGHRMSHDVVEPMGSGVAIRHAKDFLLAHDDWFRGLDLQYGPDGGVYVTDWTDTGECHNYDKVDQANGRIYKITYGDATPVHPDLGMLSDAKLLELQRHRNEWFVRRSRRLLHERAQEKSLAPETGPAIDALAKDADPLVRLRAVWLRYLTGGGIRPESLEDRSEHVRAAAASLTFEGGVLDNEALFLLARVAATDASPVVRLALAGGLQKIPPGSRLPVVQHLITRGEDAADANLPLMIWYAIEPIVSSDREKALALLAAAKIPLVRQYITRRLAEKAK